jgi:excisionase family DNA binding protein
MTVPQVAAALQISEKQVNRLIDREELPRTRIGRAVRVPESAVRRFIAQHTQPAPVVTTTPAA